MLLKSSSRVPHVSCNARSIVRPRFNSHPSRKPLRTVAFKEDEKEALKRNESAIARGRQALENVLRRRQHQQPVRKDPLSETHPVDDAQPTTGSISSDPSTTPAPATPGKRTPAPPAFEATLSVPVFSRRREVFVGRAAMAGFYASCMWECFLVGLGPLSQLSVLSGLPPLVVQGVVAAFVVHGMYGLSPTTPTWSAQNRQDMLRRPKGPPRSWVNPLDHPDEFFGYSKEWGFTKANELFAGRLAMLGFLGTCAAEPFTKNRGALGQIAWWLHLPVTHAYYEFCQYGLVFASIVFGVLAYVNRRPGQLKGGDDIY